MREGLEDQTQFSWFLPRHVSVSLW